MNSNRIHIIICLLTAILLSANGLRAQDFRATADRTQVAMDQTMRITYTLENLDTDDFTPPDFSPFEAYGPNQSRNMSWVNGKVTQSVSYTYTLKPTKEGDFQIAPAKATVNGNVRQTNPVKIKVVPAGTSASANNNNNAGNNNNKPNDPDAQLRQEIRENLFVRAIPSKTNVMEGEQVTLTYKLYYALSLDDLSILKMPVFDGFLSYDIEIGEGQSQRKVESYNGRQYNTQPIHQVALFPSKSGSFTIDPMELTSMIIIRKNDPGFFFPRSERMKHEFKSNSITLNVSPLPSEGRPSSFTGAVGKYDFSASYDKTQTQVDDPITLKIKVAGNGNIKLLDIPELRFPQSFEVYDPKIKESISKKSYTVNGNKNWEYLIIPRGGGSFQLPDITFSYFDVDAGNYVTRTEPGPLVEVEGEALNPQNYTGGGFSKEEVELLGNDIRFIKTGKLLPAASTASLITKPVFHLLTWLPILLAMFLPIIYQRQKKRHGDISQVKSRKAHKEANRRMSAARKLIASGDDKSFYNEVVKSIWGYLSDKFNLQNTELSKENTRLVLSEHAINEELQQETYNLIDTCEMAIYAPMAIQESKESIIDKASHIIQQLENEISAK